MSKTIPIALAAHYALGSTTLAWGLKITRTDGVVFGFTSADSDKTISSVLYKASPGLGISEIVTSAGLAVDNLELTTLNDGSTFTRRDVLAGVWRNAAYEIFRFNYNAPADGVEHFPAGTIGNVSIRRDQIVAELRGLQQYLQQPIGNVLSENCRARLGDSLCRVTLATYTVGGALTSVTSGLVFGDSGRAEALGYFEEGIFTFTSGPNIGLSQKVKIFASGSFTMSLPFITLPVAGNTYTVSAGCIKTRAVCSAKFSNILNFQGEPDIPGLDQLTSAP